MGLDFLNATATSDAADEILFILHLGTGISCLGALTIIFTFAAASSLHHKRALFHLVVKSFAIVIMTIGYWLDIFSSSTCYDTQFCAIQFILLQLGNCGILVSEFAMALEIYVLAKHFNSNTLDELIAKGTPYHIKAVYIFFGLLAIVSIITGLSEYLNDHEKGLYCYLGSWCWYLDPWAVFVFKFGWMIVVITFGISTITYLFYSMHLVTSDKRAVKVTSKVAVMLRNLVICHVFAWGLSFIWRVGRSLDNPPLWTTDPKSIILTLVVFNAAGAGYLDVIVWLTFPDLQREYSMKKMKEKVFYCCRSDNEVNDEVLKGEENDLEFSHVHPNREWT